MEAVRPVHCLPPALAALGGLGKAAAVLAVGKAAAGMAEAITQSLGASGVVPLPTLVIGVEEAPGVLVGDHPQPGARSRRAAEAVAGWVASLPLDVVVHVALSGGASALVAAPLPGVSNEELRYTFALLLRSGLDVAAVNAVRKRLTRWSAGRLAAALAPRRTFTWLISDVPGDDPATIGSGPCSGDTWSSADVRDLIETHQLWGIMPETVRLAIAVETIKPGAAVLRHVQVQVVARNVDALRAAERYAGALGMRTRQEAVPLAGEASDMGRTIASARLSNGESGSNEFELTVYGGETVVTLGDHCGCGGRNQELALAAAQRLAECGDRDDVMLLAAGTDGRDGPTPAAGAIIDGNTWADIADHGLNPRALLSRHEAFRALDAVGALLYTGHTGTNVMDMVLALNRKRVHLDRVEAHLLNG